MVSILRRVVFAVALFGIALHVRPALAVIELLTPLGAFIEQADAIVVARVERIEPARPGAVLFVIERLKGEWTTERLPINLTGDTPGEAPELVARLPAEARVVLFVTENGDQPWQALAYTEGSWFQLLGYVDGDRVRWAFTHFEPYLRRTYRGSTDELAAVIAAVLAGERAPPAPDTSVTPGLGPVAGAAVESTARAPPIPATSETAPAAATRPAPRSVATVDRAATLRRRVSLASLTIASLIGLALVGSMVARRR